MKKNKPIVSIGISLFSALILGGMTIQQVKADTTSQADTTGTTDTTANQSNSTQDNTTQTDSTDTSSTTDSDTQQNNTDSNIANNTTANSSDSTANTESSASTQTDTTAQTTATSNNNSETDNSSDSSNNQNNSQQSISALTTNLNSDTATSETNDTNTTQQSTTTTSADNTDSTTATDTDSQTVNITFVDQNQNEVVDSNGTPYTISGNYKVGDTIDPSDLSTKISTDLNGGYTLDANQAVITVVDGDNNYSLNVTAKTYNNVFVGISPATDGFANRNYITVGQNITLQYAGNSSNLQNIADVTSAGYGYSYLKFGQSGNKIANTEDGTFTLTYDLIPQLLETYQSSQQIYVLTAVYAEPLDQTVTIRHVDDQGNEIAGTTDETITGYKTGDVIDDPLSIATVKDVSGYTYIRTTQPFTVSDKNTIDLIYTENALNYLTVNYVDSDSGKTIYTDYLLGNSGDSVSIKDIDDISGFSNYQMTDSTQTGAYTIQSDNQVLNVDVTVRDPLSITLQQQMTGQPTVTTQKEIAYGDTINTDSFVYLADLQDVSSLVISNGTVSQTFDSDTIAAWSAGGYDISDVVGVLASAGNIVDEDSSGQAYTITINYATTKNMNISYQTADGTEIANVATTGTDSDSSMNDVVTNNLPSGYSFVDADNLYTVNTVTDDSVTLISQVEKESSSSSGGSGSGSSGSDNNSAGDKTAIEATVSTYPTLTEVKVYDDDGNLTGQTVLPNSDWYTDQKLQLDGKTYYRIATNQWLDADDVYLYYSNSTDVRTYSDSAKVLINSQAETSSRELSAGSDWYSDRYAYFNNQKYYRVATNEWVSADDVFEYQPVSQVVQPSTGAKLYDDYGNFVREAPVIDLQTDKIATINGVKMYRVATNEWLPASTIA